MLGVEQHDGGGGGGGGGMDELMSGGGSGGGNRWPKQETLALLRIRSDMDVAFRDSNLKAPLWEQVSRKMAELGFQRSSKKCKEKFENVYKYHKRTKDGRSTKPDGKSYRFFDELEAFDTGAVVPPPPPQQLLPPTPTPLTTAAPPSTKIMPSSHVNIPNSMNPSFQPPPIMAPPQQQAQTTTITFQPSHNVPPPHMLLSNSTSSSSTSSDEDVQMRRGKKRKWKDFFQRLLNDVVHKQEELQKKFFDTLEKREKDRIAREEAWRVQEMAKINREHELLVKERSVAAAKDSAVIAFLQKVSDNVKIPISNVSNYKSPPPPQPPPVQPEQSATPSSPAVASSVPSQSPISVGQSKMMVVPTTRDMNGSGSSSSRWPKAEIEALINIRTSLDFKYQDNGPKGPLWEEISGAMLKLGYTRNSKRCKEKWENINKYYKKVKESNKKRPEDSKTCPYFNQLDAIYKERAKNDQQVNTTPSTIASTIASNSTSQLFLSPPLAPAPPAPYMAGKLDRSEVAIMARPEQQWPVNNQIGTEEEEEEEEYDEEEEYEYEVVTNAKKMEVSSSNNGDDEKNNGTDGNGNDNSSGGAAGGRNGGSSSVVLE